MHRYSPTALAMVLLALVPIACSSSPASKLVAVSGRVTLNKQPLVGALVHFQPLDRAAGGPDAFGTTDEQGNFTLTANIAGRDAPGAAVGKHKVQISKLDRDAQPEPRDLVPARYNSKSELTFTVPEGGTKDAVFELKK